MGKAIQKPAVANKKSSIASSRSSSKAGIDQNELEIVEDALLKLTTCDINRCIITIKLNIEVIKDTIKCGKIRTI